MTNAHRFIISKIQSNSFVLLMGSRPSAHAFLNLCQARRHCEASCTSFFLKKKKKKKEKKKMKPKSVQLYFSQRTGALLGNKSLPGSW